NSTPPRTATIRFLQSHRNDGRIVGLEETARNDWMLTYGLRDVRGYDPPQPSARYLRLWREAEPRQIEWVSFAIESLTDPALQVASVLGAKYVVADPGSQLVGGDGREAGDG